MDIHHIRLVNLQQAIKKAGSQARLADMVGIKSAYISQIKNTKHPTNMGNDVARRIEAALGLPHGWMDVLHDNEASPINISALINVATPTYLNTLQQIQKAQDAGVLEESDKAMLKIIADKYKDRL